MAAAPETEDEHERLTDESTDDGSEEYAEKDQSTTDDDPTFDSDTMEHTVTARRKERQLAWKAGLARTQTRSWSRRWKMATTRRTWQLR
jgi:hypothetical protein